MGGTYIPYDGPAAWADASLSGHFRRALFHSGRLVRAVFKNFGCTARTFFAFWRPLLAAQARFGVARTLWGSVLEAEMQRFSRFFDVRACALLNSCEAYKTSEGAVFFAHRSFRATRQYQQKFVAKAVLTSIDGPNALVKCPDDVPTAPGDSSGRSCWSDVGRPAASQILPTI